MTTINKSALEKVFNEHFISIGYLGKLTLLRVTEELRNASWGECKNKIENAKQDLEKDVSDSNKFNFYIHIKGAIERVENDGKYQLTKNVHNQGITEINAKFSIFPIKISTDVEDREAYINKQIDYCTKKFEPVVEPSLLSEITTSLRSYFHR